MGAAGTRRSPRDYFQPLCFTGGETEAPKGEMKVTQYIGGRRGLHSRPLGSWSRFLLLHLSGSTPPTPLYPLLKPPALHHSSPLCSWAFALLGSVVGRVYLWSRGRVGR